MTVPPMLCGYEQWYGKDPAVVNCRRNTSFGPIEPESKPGASEVTVCEMTSWFVQQTVEPTVIVTWLGE